MGSRRPSVDSMHDPTHLHPQSSYRQRPRSRTSSFRRRGHLESAEVERSPSPRRFPHHSHHPHSHHGHGHGHPYHHHHHHHHEVGFSDTVSNVVEIVKHDHIHTRRHPYIRGSWSASTSPARSPSPGHAHVHHRAGVGVYGTTSLEQRSRSPSPRTARHQQHSYPVLVARRGQGRRLPPTPSKPSTLQLHPSSINFPKVNPSPTHCPPHYPAVPLSFEQAVAIGRGGRMLPSPVPNGFKPPPPPPVECERHSDSDDDDWC